MIRFPSAIHTDRLTIRPWRLDDAPALQQAVLESRERLSVWLPWVGFYDDPNAAREFIPRVAAVWEQGHELPMVLIERESGRLVGAGGYHSLEPTPSGWRSLEIGYWLREGEEGKGYMREAVRAQIRLAFELGVERLQLLCDARNEASYRVAEACGFRREATLRRDLRTHHGDLRDTRVYAILPDEASELMAGWSGERFDLEWDSPAFERPEPVQSSAPEPETRELPVIVTELLRLDPVNLLEPGVHYTVVDRGGQRHLGIASIVTGSTDLPGYVIHWRFRSPDEPIEFGIELALALLKITFEELGAERVVLRVPVTATTEREIAEITGFVNEGTLHAALNSITGAIGDYVIYSVIRDDL